MVSYVKPACEDQNKAGIPDQNAMVFSTSLLSESTKSYNSSRSVKFESSSYSSYFKFLTNILNDSSISDGEKQKKLELSLVLYTRQEMESNVVFIKKQSGLMLNFSKRTLKDLIHRAIETYNLHTNKTGVVKEISKTLMGRQNDVLYTIMLTYGLVISYYNRLGYNNISSVLGRKFLEYIYLSQKDKYIILKKSGIKYVMEGFQDFLDAHKMDGAKYTKLGDYFITLLSQYPINIFERDYKKSSFARLA